MILIILIFLLDATMDSGKDLVNKKQPTIVESSRDEP